MATSRRGSTGRGGTERLKRGDRTRAGGAQRRLVTVLFCDLVRSAELASRIDPEDMRDVLHAYLNAFARRIEAAGGFIARYMGDGVLAYFGYPLARDGDPARAVRAALEVCAAAQTLEPPHGHRLAVRCGVATGLTVIGDLVGRGQASERGAIGSAPNLAARLQTVAAPGETVICAATAELTPGLFGLKPIGNLSLKGFPQTRKAFRVVAASEGAGPLAQRLAHRRAPFAGRAREMTALLGAWRRARKGGAIFVPVSGEAGLGKSRLIYEFQKAIRATPHLWFEVAADPSRDASAYAIARRLIRMPRGVEAKTLTVDRLKDLLAQSGLPVATALPLIGGLLGLTGDDATVGAEDRRRQLHQILIDWLRGMSRTRPCVLVIEDLQWVDPSSLELLRALLATRGPARLLVIGSSRTEIEMLARHAAPSDVVRLSPLDDAAIGSIVTRLAGPDLAPAGLAALVARSDGNPLFAEELAAHVAAGPAQVQALPDTLTGLLTARLDATGPAAALARVASVLGPVFDGGMLQRFARLPLRQVRDEMAVLARADLIASRGRQHAFRHALIHEAAYGSLLKDDRRALHRRAALLMEKSGAALEAAARHWREAGEPRRAVDAYRMLGRACAADGAYGEAAEAYRAALEVLAAMPASPERDLEDIEIASALTDALQITEGYSAPAATQTAARARLLAERLGDSGGLFNQVAAEWMAASTAGDYAAARLLAARAMPLAEAAGGGETLGTAFMMRMTTAYRAGALVEGEMVFRAGARHFASAAFRKRVGAVPQTFGNAAINAWLLGRRAEARRLNARVVAHGETVETPFLRAFANFMAAAVFVLMAEPEKAARSARDAVAISDAEGFPQFAAAARIVLGRAVAMLGRRREGIALMKAGLDRMVINRSRNGLTMYLTWLAETHLESRDRGAARALCDQALGVIPEERFFRGETLRVRALCAADAAERDAFLAEALALARSIGAAWTEARVRAALPAATGRAAASRRA